jgi:hypothetical protein
MAAAVAVVVAGLTAGVAGAAPPERNAPPPPASALAEATNAMLQQGDVPTALASAKPDEIALYPFRTGYVNSLAGGDPIAVCSAPGTFKQVFPTTEGTIVFQARAAGANLVQYVYSYPSDAAATAAWAKLSQQITSLCKGSVKSDGSTQSASSSPIPGLGGVNGLGVTSSTDDQYSTVHLLGSTIQMVSIVGSDKSTNKIGRVAAINSLATTLAGRWVARSNLPFTQDPFITRASRSLLQPADLTSATPVRQPAQGGVYDFDAVVSAGSGPVPCAVNSSEDVKSTGSSGSAGSTMGVNWDDPQFSMPGVLDQSVIRYDSSAAAQRAWSELRRSLVKCVNNAQGPIPANKDFERTVTGVLAAGVGGEAGLWSREVSRAIGGVASAPFSKTTYSTYLLFDNTIQIVSYSRTVKGMKEVPLDQAAVNALAATLAKRWADNR